MQNVERGNVAEFLVAWAIGVDDKPGQVWEPFDLISIDGKKIEIKCTAAVQSWTYAKKATPKFVIKPHAYYSEKDGYAKEKKYNADIYVFCYHKEEIRGNLDVMNLDQWDFWVFSKEDLLNLLRGRKSITIKRMKSEGHKPVSFQGIRSLAEF